MACPDIVANPLKLFADPPYVPATITNGNDGVASTREGRGLVRKERNPHCFGLRFNGLQLAHEAVQRGCASKQLFELEIDSTDTPANAERAVRLGSFGAGRPTPADGSDLDHQKPGRPFDATLWECRRVTAAASRKASRPLRSDAACKATVVL
jgi:hypothetical protein